MEQMRNRGGLVEIINSNDASSIYFAYSILNEKGIFARVENENTNNLPGLSVGVSLMVKEEDTERVLALLREADLLPPQEESHEELAETLATEGRNKWRKLAGLLTALAMLLGLLALWTLILNQ